MQLLLLQLAAAVKSIAVVAATSVATAAAVVTAADVAVAAPTDASTADFNVLSPAAVFTAVADNVAIPLLLLLL